MAEHFTSAAQKALNHALTIAKELGHTYIGTEHLLLGIASEKEGAAYPFLEARGIVYKSVKNAVVETAGTGIRSLLTPDHMTPRCKRVIEKSGFYITKTNGAMIGTEHLLYSLLEEKEGVAIHILEFLGCDITEMKTDLLSFITSGKRFDAKQRSAKTQEIPSLAGFSRDLTELAIQDKLDPVIGRDKETDRVIRILSRRTKNNPCLIGEPGVGKTAIAEGLARRIVANDVPDCLKGKSILTLDLSAMIAGAKYRGEFEERMKTLIKEIQKHPEILLFIDEIHTIIGAGGAEGAIDAANILKPALARGELRVIGATTIEEYRKHIEKDAALERRFQPVLVEAPSDDATYQILCGIKGYYEQHHRVQFSEEALRSAVTLSSRYIHDRFQPDKSIDLLDETAARVRLSDLTRDDEWQDMRDLWELAHREKENAIRRQNFSLAVFYHNEEKRLENRMSQSAQVGVAEFPSMLPIVTDEDIAKTVTEWTGIPTSRLKKDEALSLQRLESAISSVIIGQDKAIHTISQAIIRGKVGIKDPCRPIGCFLFAGPTGVGKTALCKAIAKELFGSENAMIRLNMSEYKESFSISKLIGSPPGYVGFEEGGQLTERVRRTPYSLLLLDEIEKAHPDIYNILLQIMDEGVLNDSQGRRVDFKNTLIILTSNIGSYDAPSRIKLGFQDIGQIDMQEESDVRVTEAVKQVFRPEFINRLDEIVVFQHLTQEHCIHITKKLLEDVTMRVSELGYSLSFDDTVVDLIVEKGFDVQYGARPLKRVITHMIENPLSEAMLKEDLNLGDEIEMTAEDNRIVIKKGTPSY